MTRGWRIQLRMDGCATCAVVVVCVLWAQLDERDLVVGNVYRKLMEIESRLLPCGLHVIGVMPTAEEAVATLVNIGEIDRPDNTPPVKGLPGIMARAVGRDIEEVYRNSNRGVLADVDLLQQITEACRDCVREFVRGAWGLWCFWGGRGAGGGGQSCRVRRRHSVAPGAHGVCVAWRGVVRRRPHGPGRAHWPELADGAVQVDGLLRGPAAARAARHQVRHGLARRHAQHVQVPRVLPRAGERAALSPSPLSPPLPPISSARAATPAPPAALIRTILRDAEWVLNAAVRLGGGCARPQVVKENEVGALVDGLNGKYVEPGPGGDPIRNPSVLPTGKNIHALDPQSIPTAVSPAPTSAPSPLPPFLPRTCSALARSVSLPRLNCCVGGAARCLLACRAGGAQERQDCGGPPAGAPED